jgi:hypothetical protein
MERPTVKTRRSASLGVALAVLAVVRGPSGGIPPVTAADRAAISDAVEKALILNLSASDPAAERDPNFQDFGSRLESLRLTELTMAGDTAQVTADEVVVMSTAHRNPEGKWVPYRATNNLIVTMTLTKNAAGKWLVSAFDWTFLNGSGP